MNGESYEWWAAQVAADIAEDEAGDVTLVTAEEYEQSITATKERELVARDNEAYRRDFPEVEIEAGRRGFEDDADRWADDGGFVVDVNTYGGRQRSIYVPRPNTLGELLNRNLDLEAPVPEGAEVSSYSLADVSDNLEMVIMVTKGNE